MRKTLNQQFNADQKEKNRDGKHDRVYVHDVFRLFAPNLDKMILKLFRAMWFLSALVVLANLLYVYASLPEVVVIQSGDVVSLSREWLFYIALLIIVGVNLLVYLFKLMFADGENVRTWFHGQVITFNIFFIIALQALNVFNSNENFDHSLVSIYLTGSLTLILLWAAGWPVYLLIQRFVVKQAV